MKRKDILFTFVITFAATATCYSIGGGHSEESSDFFDKSYQSFKGYNVPDEYFKAFFGNSGNRVAYPAKNVHTNYVIPKRTTYPTEKYLYNFEQRADFGNYDLFRGQVEGNRYNPRGYYGRSLPKSRTNSPGFAQKVVFEDEIPFRAF